MAITREQIWAAADEIDAAGQNPTLAAVRKAVGGGSFTTIQDAMTEWKAKKAAKASPLREPPPASLAERLQELAGDVWTTAMEMATARLEVEREALEKARAEQDAARLEAAELADQLTAELDEARARVVELERGAAAMQSESAGLRERLAVAEAKEAETSRRMHVERQAADQARLAAAAAREDAARLQGQVEALEKQQRELLGKLGTAAGKKGQGAR